KARNALSALNAPTALALPSLPCSPPVLRLGRITPPERRAETETAVGAVACRWRRCVADATPPRLVRLAVVHENVEDAVRVAVDEIGGRGVEGDIPAVRTDRRGVCAC